MRWRRRVGGLGAGLVALLAAASPAPAAFEGSGAAAELMAAQSTLPPGFQETIAFSGLDQPTAVRFAPDGRIFVAEKRGTIQVFSDFGDPTPTLYADLQSQVYAAWDRGLLGIALDPQFAPGREYVYALYSYDKDPNSAQSPRWNDACPAPPGPNDDGCVISGRLSRLNNGSEQVLIEDWCQQYPSHSVGSLAFGPDGALYVSGGDGASYTFADYGQDGSPRNPCGDPPGGRGGAMTLPTAEGGALRSQDMRTTGDPAGLDGTILRVNPDTGAAMAGNPNSASPDPNARRIVAYGLRNPFRFAVRPGTNEIWTGDVGWGSWEEINRIPNPTATVRNFGWPCYEGTGRMSSYDTLNLNVCETLYSQGAVAHTAPYYTYHHSANVVPGEACGTGSSSISGVAFTPASSSFPPEYDGALFFADYSRACIWAMLRGSDGLPDPANRQTFVANAATPVELQFGPGGDLYYADIVGGTIRRIRSTTTNRAPVARATATPSTGNVPLIVAFNGSASSDPEGQAITYAWDLDGDGAFDDGTSPTANWTYTVESTYTARLRVRDPGGLTDTVNLPITAGAPPVPVITISAPAPGMTWKVGDTIAFSGSATDHAGAAIPPSGLTWDVQLQHCDRLTGSCHSHPTQSFVGVASGSFPAPDHEYPSYLEVELTARDSHGLTGTAVRRLNPRTARLTLASQPAGAALTFGFETAAAPFTREVIVGSSNSIGADSPQTLGGFPHRFSAWSNGGARTHTTVVTGDTTLTATFTRSYLRKMAGADVIGSQFGSQASPGEAEAYRTVAEQSGTATELNLFLSNFSTASDLVLGLYADAGGVPTTLLGSGRIEDPLPAAWNRVEVDIPGIVAGHAYWIGLLNPSDGTGTLSWHDHAGGSGGPELEAASNSLGALPTTWATGRPWDGGPLSAYVAGTPATVLDVSPAALAFSGAAPAAKTLDVTNAVGGPLAFTASDDAAWLSVTPAAGNAPGQLSVAVDSTGLAPGTYAATVRVESAGAEESPRLVPVTLTVDAPAVVSESARGPVGAWGFDEAGGKRVRDDSGTGNTGRISGAVRTRGRFGGGLSFDGRNDWVTVGDDPSLDLERALTLEAWVKPSRRGTVLLKERGPRLSYGLYARPSGHVFTRAEHALRGPALPLRRWSHLAMTWDGSVVRVYRNGVRVASHALSGAAATSDGPLRIGGNAIWPEFFKGVIDEVRVYDRALSAGEIARDRDAAIAPDAKRPKTRTSRGGKLRRTKREVHRGTRWL
jgi:glucose/arabinose dehydrogenase